MKAKKQVNLDDNLIREALQLEIGSVEPPPAAEMWRAIEAKIVAQQPRPRRTLSGRVRYAGLVAACLLVLLGGFGLFRAVQYATPDSEFKAAAEFEAAEDLPAGAAAEAPAQPDQEKAALEVKGEENLTIAALDEETEAAAEQAPVEGYTVPEAAAETALLWPAEIGPQYLFEEEIQLPVPAEVDQYRVALYSSADHDLLLIGSEIAEEDMVLFIEKLGVQLNFPIRNIAMENGYLFFEAGGYLGLALQQAGYNRAILVPAEKIEKEQLKQLAAFFSD